MKMSDRQVKSEPLKYHMNSSKVGIESRIADQSIPATSSIDLFLRKYQSRIVASFCLYAAIRILIFSAAFPIFNPTDELLHFDLVHKYSRGYVVAPDLPLLDPEAARVITLYGSAEYLTRQEALQSVHMDVPIATLPPELRAERYQHWFTYWMKRQNVEAHSPPMYYAIASVWYRIGTGLGLKDWLLAYWVRFLNVIIYSILVWISYVFVKNAFPDRDFLRLAVPALIAVFPQDVFFGINRAALSALFSAVTLLLLLRVLQRKTAHPLLIGGGALCVGLAFLIDISNWVLFGVLAVILWVRFKRALQPPRGPELSAVLLGFLTAILPPALWMAHNYLALGDLTGTKAKTVALGWTLKPWHEILQHPIFSWHGLSYFLQALMRTYWRGEYRWHDSPMRLAVSDWFYVVSSYLLIVIIMVYLVLQRKSANDLHRLWGFLSLYLVTASALFLAAISLPYDFHDCLYPSRLYPYFVSGRIISGTLLPFALLYASGLEVLFMQVRKWIHPAAALAAIMLFITVSEVIVRIDVFHSPFNFFALWS